MIDPIDCPHCKGKISLTTKDGAIIKLDAKTIQNLENETIAYLTIDKNLKIMPVVEMKNVEIRQ